jgi:hypothetical protein
MMKLMGWFKPSLSSKKSAEKRRCPILVPDGERLICLVSAVLHALRLGLFSVGCEIASKHLFEEY